MPSPNDELKISDLLNVYKEICQNIRASDDISFKLLGIVPVVSGIGSGALAILQKNNYWEEYSALVVVLLSVIGAIATAGLFRWEMRNIQKCNWLISRAANFEHQFLGENFQFGGMTKKEDLSVIKMGDIDISSLSKNLFKSKWGKTESEKLVYLTAIAAWLVPLGIAIHRLFFSA